MQWILDNQERANGTDLQVAIAHIGYAELAAAFAKVTGQKARYVDVSLEEFWTDGPIARAANSSAGRSIYIPDICPDSKRPQVTMPIRKILQR